MGALAASFRAGALGWRLLENIEITTMMTATLTRRYCWARLETTPGGRSVWSTTCFGSDKDGELSDIRISLELLGLPLESQSFLTDLEVAFLHHFRHYVGPI